MKIRKYLLDSNIYGEMVVDAEIEELKRTYEQCKDIVLVYGIKQIIRKELRDTPKNIKIKEKKLRSNLLGLYDIFAEKHNITLIQEYGRVADNYYESYRKNGGTKPRGELHNDLLIVACASCKGMNVVVSEDEKTMLSENAFKAYNLVNAASNKRTPRFIGYREFKAELRSCLSNKLVCRSDKFWVFLVFLDFLNQLVKIRLFALHILGISQSNIKSFRLI